jgi:hypothetical protein
VASEGHAADLLASAIRSAPGEVTVITLGPLTNVAEALDRDPTLAARIGRLFLMGGTLDWSAFPTTGLDTHDYNLWVDAPAAQAVLDALPAHTSMTGHEATKFVPLTERFRQRLGADRTTPAAATVYTMASNPLLIGAEADNQGPNSQGIAWTTKGRSSTMDRPPVPTGSSRTSSTCSMPGTRRRADRGCGVVGGGVHRPRPPTDVIEVTGPVR